MHMRARVATGMSAVAGRGLHLGRLAPAAASSGSSSAASQQPPASQPPIYSRSSDLPSSPSSATAAARSRSATAALAREAASVAARAAENPLQADGRGSGVVLGPERIRGTDGRRVEEVHPEAEPSQEELRAGLVDPSDPDFRFTVDPPFRRALLLIAFVAGPLLAYHFSLTIRAWTDEQIAKVQEWYDAKYGKPGPKVDFFAPPSAAAAPSSPTSSPSSAPAAPAQQELKSKLSFTGSGKADVSGPRTTTKPQEDKSSKNVTTSKTQADNPAKTDASKSSDSKKGAGAGGAAPASSPPVDLSSATLTLVPSSTPGGAATLLVEPAPPSTLPPIDHSASVARRLAEEIERQRLQQLHRDLLTLLELERMADRMPRAVDEDVRAVAELVAVRTEPLPASKAVKELQELFVSAGLKLPTLPPAPRWTTNPSTVAEARDRLQQIESFKRDFELAVVEQTAALQAQLESELTPRLRALYDGAERDFDSQLALRLRAEEKTTRDALEAGELIGIAATAQEIIKEEAGKWTKLSAEEMAKQQAHLVKETKRVLDEKERAVRRELQPGLDQRVKALREQQKRIAELRASLSTSKNIEAAGVRIHRLTNILVHLEEALRLDEHKAPLFMSAAEARPNALPSQQVAPPKTSADLQNVWRTLLDAAKGDAELERLANAVPLDMLGAHTDAAHHSAPSSEEDADASLLPTLSTLRKRFNDQVEPAVRVATFLPAHVADADRTLMPQVYARLASLLTLREGQALRDAGVDGSDGDDARDAALLNNASYLLNHARDLPGAVEQLEQLSPRPRAQAARWVQQAQQRVHVERVFGWIRQHVEKKATTYMQQEREKDAHKHKSSS